MSTILALDPGTTHTAFLQYQGASGQVHSHGFVENSEMLRRLRYPSDHPCDHYDSLAIEMIASYGMPVGREVFETVLWIGRFMERSELNARLVFRKDIKLHLCQSARAKDANVRQALIDRFGGKTVAIGNAKQKGPLHGISKHSWAALAVAIYAHDTTTPETI